MALASRRDDHPDYRECQDPDCPRFPCRLWKEAYWRGFEDGRSVGFAEGYAAGFAAGVAAASR